MLAISEEDGTKEELVKMVEADSYYASVVAKVCLTNFFFTDVS